MKLEVGVKSLERWISPKVNNLMKIDDHDQDVPTGRENEIVSDKLQLLIG